MKDWIVGRNSMLDGVNSHATTSSAINEAEGSISESNYFPLFKSKFISQGNSASNLQQFSLRPIRFRPACLYPA